MWNYCAIFHRKNSVWSVFVCVCWLLSIRPSPGYGISSAGRACECWKATRNLCAAFASTTKELSAAPTMGQCYTLTLGSLCCGAVWVLNWTEGNVCTHSKIKVWDLQAALDPRAPASTLCLRTLVVSVHDFYLFSISFYFIFWFICFFHLVKLSFKFIPYFTCFVFGSQIRFNALLFFFWIVSRDTETCFHKVW